MSYGGIQKLMYDKLSYHLLFITGGLEKSCGLKLSMVNRTLLGYDTALYLLTNTDLPKRIKRKDAKELKHIIEKLETLIESGKGKTIGELRTSNNVGDVAHEMKYWLEFDGYINHMWNIIKKYVKPVDLNERVFEKYVKHELRRLP